MMLSFQRFQKELDEIKVPDETKENGNSLCFLSTFEFSNLDRHQGQL